jgi:hypothetical protein
MAGAFGVFILILGSSGVDWTILVFLIGIVALPLAIASFFASTFGSNHPAAAGRYCRPVVRSPPEDRRILQYALLAMTVCLGYLAIAIIYHTV